MQSKLETINSYIASIKEQEDDNYKIFCPRREEQKNKNEIEKETLEKLQIEKKIEQYNEKIKKINKYIKVLNKDTQKEEKDWKVLFAQEEERQRIARDLHDTSLQNLVHVIHKIELCSLYIDEDPLKAKLELAVISKNIRAIMDEIRNTIYDLRPMSFDDLGFKEVLEKLLDEIGKNNQFVVEKDIGNISCDNNVILLSIYRVIQECLSNIIKHSQGNYLYFQCKEVDHYCFIEIKDNGKGFLKEEILKKGSNHFGLSVIKERIDILEGDLKIDSRPGEGTNINIKVPLKDKG